MKESLDNFYNLVLTIFIFDTCFGNILSVEDTIIKSIVLPTATVIVFRACNTALIESGAYKI